MESVTDDLSDFLGYWKGIAFFSTSVAIAISTTHIFKHAVCNPHWEIKRCTIRMLLLVPIYSADAMVCLLQEDKRREWAGLLTSFRDLYEAIVVVSFLQFVIIVFGSVEYHRISPVLGLSELMLTHKPEHTGILTVWRFFGIHRPPPWLYSPGPGFVYAVLIGIFQYIFATVGEMILETIIFLLSGVSEEGPTPGTSSTFIACVYLSIFAKSLKACSAGFAMYNLILLGVNLESCEKTKHIAEEAHIRSKFLCVKGIVFFTFAQKYVLQLLQVFGMLPILFNQKRVAMSQNRVLSTLEQLLICFELLLFAFWHWEAYPVNEFIKRVAQEKLMKAYLVGSHAELQEAVSEAEPYLRGEVVVVDFASVQKNMEWFGGGGSTSDAEALTMTMLRDPCDARLAHQPIHVCMQEKLLTDAKDKLSKDKDLQSDLSCKPDFGTWVRDNNFFVQVVYDIFEIRRSALRMRRATDALQTDPALDVETLFRLFDFDGNDRLDRFEAHALMKACGMEDDKTQQILGKMVEERGRIRRESLEDILGRGAELSTPLLAGGN
uniref:EF-hand domain-containing protein n=1 Tax=Noctiluca scintillans TaxID=2966 RepID=A0A7S1A4H7_NOCSC|mmetsp:Transcript_31446/g.83762  ORF Transcript_31446/g.83762 Transcript_31446/m.83762 type:complete len:549 (+) Transcript_31446:44-1690(+)